MENIEPTETRVLRALTSSVELRITRKVRVLANYEARWLTAPDGSEDAKTIARTMGHRVLAQVTVFVP